MNAVTLTPAIKMLFFFIKGGLLALMNSLQCKLEKVQFQKKFGVQPPENKVY